MRRIDLTKAQAARSSTIRDINRQFVLNYIRDREPISRAEIARSTDLQRSTVSTIVEELKDEGLIEEIGAGASTGGRRPTLLRLRAAGATAIGVDITPSATTIATSDLVGRVIARERFENSPRPEELAAQVIERLRDIAGREHQGAIAGVGVSLPGLVDTGSGRAIYIPFFRWRDWPIAEEIGRATGLKAFVDNDANAAALAELWFGRPEVSGARDFILALVAEGIGTGDRYVARLVANSGTPAMACLNKVDLLDKPTQALPVVQAVSELGDWREVFQISAAEGTNLDPLMEAVVGMLPPGPKYFGQSVATW